MTALTEFKVLDRNIETNLDEDIAFELVRTTLQLFLFDPSEPSIRTICLALRLRIVDACLPCTGCTGWKHIRRIYSKTNRDEFEAWFEIIDANDENYLIEHASKIAQFMLVQDITAREFLNNLEDNLALSRL